MSNASMEPKIWYRLARYWTTSPTASKLASTPPPQMHICYQDSISTKCQQARPPRKLLREQDLASCTKLILTRYQKPFTSTTTCKRNTGNYNKIQLSAPYLTTTNTSSAKSLTTSEIWLKQNHGLRQNAMIADKKRYCKPCFLPLQTTHGPICQFIPAPSSVHERNNKHLFRSHHKLMMMKRTCTLATDMCKLRN